MCNEEGHDFLHLFTGHVDMPYICSYIIVDCGMPLIRSRNCTVVECVMWNGTRLNVCLISMLVCPVFVNILFCKAECHTFVQATVDFYMK